MLLSWLSVQLTALFVCLFVSTLQLTLVRPARLRSLSLLCESSFCAILCVQIDVAGESTSPKGLLSNMSPPFLATAPSDVSKVCLFGQMVAVADLRIRVAEQIAPLVPQSPMSPVSSHEMSLESPRELPDRLAVSITDVELPYDWADHEDLEQQSPSAPLRVFHTGGQCLSLARWSLSSITTHVCFFQQVPRHRPRSCT